LARPWRIQYGEAYYHVLSRGNEGRNVFFDDGDRKLFLRTNLPSFSRATKWVEQNCSAVSHIVKDVRGRIQMAPQLGSRAKKINSQFKM
jgi:hypothetical protein